MVGIRIVEKSYMFVLLYNNILFVLSFLQKEINFFFEFFGTSLDGWKGKITVVSSVIIRYVGLPFVCGWRIGYHRKHTRTGRLLFHR